MDKKALLEEKQLKNEEVILYPLISEKAVNLIEAENKLCFVVNPKSSKIDVKKAVEEMYSVKVASVKSCWDTKGRKKAFVKLKKGFKASDLATRLGVI